MIKKILSLFTVLVLCSGASYMDQEQKYFFASDALIEALQNNVDDEQKRVDAATKYSELMNQQTGMVSIDNLFAVCRAAGFNTYKKDGFDSCKQLINTLVELDEDTLTGFCPGLDANGNNPNGLKSITDKTRIGDFCSSTNIYAGEVVFKKGYNCTCMAYACNDGYEFKGGACVTIVADGQGFCLRSDNKIQKDMKVEEAKAFCENLANKNKCKYKSAVILHKELRILCNATREEIDNAKQIMADHKERQKAAIKYYEVCGKDKNINGKNKYCVEDFFNWTQTQTDQAIGFAQEYARIKNNHTVYCKNQHRESGNDDYIACSTMDGSAVYEFKFDDIKESVDKDRRRTERSALCRLAGGDVGFFDASNDVCKNLNTAQCANLDKLAKKYGHEAKWDKNKCRFTDYGHETMSGEDFDKSLAKIDGLDNYAFFNIQVISIRNNFALEEEMKKYIKNNLSGYQEVRCDPGYRTIKKADGFLAKVVGNHDDIKRCYANDKPIDFVVDDLSELVGYERDSGESGAKCIANDGKFDGHYCRGLTKDECFELERLMLKELKSRGWAGDDDLVDWDERAGACELNASQFANNLNKTGKYTAIAGLTIAGVFTGGSTTAVAVSLMSVELAGMAGEIVTERQKELLPQRWANRFLAESMVCKQASCAEKTLRENMGKIAQASDMLNRDVLKQVDDELARLAELLPDDRLAEILQNPKAPGCWETWECQETIFTVMQMASLGAAVGKALVKLPQVLSKRFAAAAAKNATNGAVHAGTVTNAVTKAIDNTADAATKAASKADDVVDAVWDAKAMRFHDPKTGRFVSGYTKWSDELSEIGVKESVVNGKKVYTDVKTGATLSETQVLNKIPTSMNDDFAKIGVKQIEQADGTIRYLDITPGGGNKFISEAEVLKRIDDMPVEAAKAIDNTADAARGASKADDVADVAKQLTPTTPRSAVRSKLGDNINSIIDDVKAGKSPDVVLESSALSKEEWKVLKEELAREGMDLREQGTLHYLVEKPKISMGTKTGDIMTGTAKKIDTATDAARGVSNTANNTADVARTANKADDLSVITKKVSDNYDDMINAIKSGRNDVMYVPKSNLSESEWKILQESLRKEGLEMIDVPGNSASYGIEQVMIAKRGTEIDGLVFGGARTAGKTNAATDAARATDKADDATRAANLYEDWKVVRKGRETYDFDFAVLGNNEKELSEFIGYVQKDGYYVQKVGNRIFVKDAFNDLYKKAAAGERSVFAKKDVLSPQRWEELNKRVSGLGLKFVDDESKGFMKLVGETPVKIGDELWESLKSRNWKGVRKNGFYYMFADGVPGGQHATGLKFHISVSPDDLDKATDVIGGAMKRSGIGGDFKVYLDPDDMTWMKQTGKEFTVYVSQDGYNSSKIQQFISECEQGLRNAGVKANGFGSNVSGGDRAVSGSRYIRYRYDQLDDLGRPQGFYRSKYDFVAPNAQNGGDIMNGISAI